MGTTDADRGMQTWGCGPWDADPIGPFPSIPAVHSPPGRGKQPSGSLLDPGAACPSFGSWEATRCIPPREIRGGFPFVVGCSVRGSLNRGRLLGGRPGAEPPPWGTGSGSALNVGARPPRHPLPLSPGKEDAAARGSRKLIN